MCQVNAWFRKLIKALMVTALILIMLIIASPWLLYAYGIRALPSDLKPEQTSLPQNIQALLWFSETGSRERLMQPVSVLDYVTAFTQADIGAFPASLRISSLAASQSLPHGPGFRAIKVVAASLWISQHLTAEQAMNIVTTNNFMGYGFKGFEQAAQGYFGRPLKQLNTTEAAALVTIMRSPAYFNPWCRQEQFMERTQQLLQAYDRNSLDTLHLLPAPNHACD